MQWRAYCPVASTPKLGYPISTRPRFDGWCAHFHGSVVRASSIGHGPRLEVVVCEHSLCQRDGQTRGESGSIDFLKCSIDRLSLNRIVVDSATGAATEQRPQSSQSQAIAQSAQRPPEPIGQYCCGTGPAPLRRCVLHTVLAILSLITGQQFEAVARIDSLENRNDTRRNLVGGISVRGLELVLARNSRM